VEVNLESSIVGLGIQWAGIFLVTILSFLLTRSVCRDFLDYWTIAWSCMALGLSALLVTFCLHVNPKACYTFYCLGEYAFGYLFVAGCRNLASGVQLRRRDLWALPLGVLVAIALPQFCDSFSTLLIPHSAILAAFWIVSFCVLRPARLQKHWGSGLKVMSVALLLLTLDFLQYMPTNAYTTITGHPTSFTYLKYSSLYDLILEILLGFGTVMAVMESIRGELEDANLELAEAGSRLKVLAERDPLTEALNRHAFYAFLEKNPNQNKTRGSLAIVDVDDFKSINDSLGHSAGDAAIRAVASAIRSIIRADDLLIRWGGDEFLVVLVGLAESEARARLSKLNGILARTSLPGMDESVLLGVSCGIASFEDAAGLERAIDSADREMYLCKQAQKTAANEDSGYPPQLVGIT